MSVVKGENKRFARQTSRAARIRRDLAGQNEVVSGVFEVYYVFFKARGRHDILSLPGFEYSVVHKRGDYAEILFFLRGAGYCKTAAYREQRQDKYGGKFLHNHSLRHIAAIMSGKMPFRSAICLDIYNVNNIYYIIRRV